MEKLEKKKMAPIFVALILVLSVFVIVPQVTADPFIGVFPDVVKI